MRVTGLRLVLVLAATAGATALVLAPGISAAPAPSSVIVVNTSNQPVPTSIVGTPTVSVSGPVTVQPAREPYQATVLVSSSGSESCDPIAVPAGKRVWIENFSADASSSGAEPDVYLRVDAATDVNTQFVRAVPIDLQPVAGSFGGSTQLLLHTGSPAPGPRSFTIYACVFPASGTSADARAFVSGWMENG